MRGRRASTFSGNVWGYARVSSDKQEREGTSLEGQPEAIRRWCRSAGLPAPTHIAIEVESGAAEKNERRVEQIAIQKRAKAGDIIVVAAVDRWSRDIVHIVSSVRALVARGVRWFAVREQLDATTREGEERLGLMAWVADSERRRIRDRTIGRKMELRDEGYYVNGTPHLGYAVKDRRLVPGPEAHIPRMIFERVAAGVRVSELEKTVPLPKGRTKWDGAYLRRVLHNRVYLGESKRSDGTWQPTHEPLVDRDTFERAQEAMKRRTHIGRPPGEGWTAERMLRSLAWCSVCGKRVTVTLGRPRIMGGRSQAYVCSGRLNGLCNAGRFVHAERLDALAAQALLKRLVELRHELAKVPTPAKEAPPRKDYAAALAKAKRNRQRLITLAVEGDITQKELRERLAKIDTEVGRLELAAAAERRRQAAEERAARKDVRAEMLERVETLTATWQRTPPAVRRDLLAIFAERIEVIPSPKARTHDVIPPKIRWRSIADLTADR